MVVDKVWYDDCMERTWGDFANGWKAGDSGFNMWEVCNDECVSGIVEEPERELKSLPWTLQKWLLALETEVTGETQGEPV